MPKAIELLMQRGYWKSADEGGDGSSGGDAGDSGSGSDNEGGADKGDKGSDGASDSDDSDGDKSGGGISDKEAELLRDLMKKKEANKELKGKLSELETKLKSWDGLNPEEVRALVKEKQDAETAKLEAKGQFEKVKEQILDAHKKELQAKDDEIAALKAQLDGSAGTIEKLTVGHSFDNSKFIAEEMTLTPRKARVVFGSHFDIEEGRVVAYDKPRGESGRAQLVDGKGDPLGFEAALKKLVETDPDADTLIRSKAKPGAGSKTVRDAAPDASSSKRSGLERISAGLTAQSKG